MSLTANLHLRNVEVGSIRVDDCSATSVGELLAVRIADLSLIGTLADALAVIGRAHEQLLALQADRQAATVPARAVLDGPPWLSVSWWAARADPDGDDTAGEAGASVEPT